MKRTLLAVPNSPKRAIEALIAMRISRQLTERAANLLGALYLLAWDDGFAHLDLPEYADYIGLRGDALDFALGELVRKSMVRLRPVAVTDRIVEVLALSSIDRSTSGLGWWEFYELNSAA